MAINLRAEVPRRGGAFSRGFQAGLLAQMAQLRGTALTRDWGAEAGEGSRHARQNWLSTCTNQKRPRHAQDHRTHKPPALIHDPAPRRAAPRAGAEPTPAPPQHRPRRGRRRGPAGLAATAAAEGGGRLGRCPHPPAPERLPPAAAPAPAPPGRP